MKLHYILFFSTLLACSKSNIAMDSLTQVEASKEQNYLQILPSELYLHITNALFDYRSLSRTTRSYRRLNRTCKSTRAILANDITATVTTVSKRYHTPPFVAAAYISTQAAKKWLDQEEQTPYETYINTDPQHLARINAARYLAASKAATRLAIVSKGKRSKNIARFFKSKINLSMSSNLPTDCSESENELVELNSNENSFRILTKKEIDKRTITVYPYSFIQIDNDGNPWVVGISQDKMNFHRQDRRYMAHYFMTCATSHNYQLEDFIIHNNDFFLLLRSNQDRKKIAFERLVKCKERLFNDWTSRLQSTSFSNHQKICLVRTPNSIIIGDKDSYQKIYEFDFSGSTIY